jgi:hypothetical protein
MDNLYGTTVFGGDYNGGTVFQVNPEDAEMGAPQFPLLSAVFCRTPGTLVDGRVSTQWWGRGGLHGHLEVAKKAPDVLNFRRASSDRIFSRAQSGRRG